MKKLVIFLCVLCLLSGCAAPAASSVTLYFPSRDGSTILEKTCRIRSGEDLLPAAIRSLLEGPKTPSMRRVIPKGTTLLSIRTLGTVTEINLSAPFDTGTPSERLLSRYTVLYTACTVPDVEKVRLLVDGEPLRSLNNGEILGALGKTDISLSGPVGQVPQLLTLYFPDEESLRLHAESRQLSLADGQTPEQAILRALFEGSSLPGLSHPVTKNLALLDAETRAGICFVNVDASFLRENSGDRARETMAVYSIVNSLCGLAHIEEVQFLIEGKKVEKFGHLAFTRGFTENKALYAPR